MMADYALPYLSLDWNMQQLPTYQSLALANDISSRNYRKALSRVSKPSSAGNSPHSQTRRRTMTAYNGLGQVVPIQHAIHMNNNMTNNMTNNMNNNNNNKVNMPVQRLRSRPTSWHPSMKQASQQPYYVPNCHPSWLRDASVALEQQQQQSGMTSMYGLSTPITCPISGDLLSTNDYFGSHTESYNYMPPGPQVYTPVEPSDTLYSEPSEWTNFSMDSTPLSTYPWMQHNNGFIPADQMIEFGHESVASADDLTAPPTPDMHPQDCMTYNHNTGTQQTLISNQDNAKGDDLVAVGLYDEPEAFSFGSTLLGGGAFEACHRSTGKGLKLEETFSPAPEADDDEDGEGENDDDPDCLEQ